MLNIFFLFSKRFPFKINIKNVQYVRGQWLMNMCIQFQVDIFKNCSDMTQNMSKTDTFHVISELYRDFPNFILTDFDVSKSLEGNFFAFFAKIWPKHMYRTSKSRFFCLTFFIWWPEMTLPSIMVTKHSEWYLQMSETLSMPIVLLALFVLNIAILLVDVTKPEMSNIFYFDLTCDDTRDLEVNKICFPITVFPELSNAAWIFLIGPVVSDIRGGLEIAPQWGAL